jgi:REP-associated tyrosine transposase
MNRIPATGGRGYVVSFRHIRLGLAGEETRNEDAMNRVPTTKISGGNRLMGYDPEKHHRRSTRLKGYDYSQPGYYYVTLCIDERRRLFGDVIDGEMHLSDCGQVAHTIWSGLPQYFPGVEIDQFVIMPNHLHGIVVLSGGSTHIGESGDATTRDDTVKHSMPMPMSGPAPTLGQIIRKFKALTSYSLHKAGFAEFAWQERYIEHVVRNPPDLKRIREYIANNPTRWAEDEHYMS